MKKTFEGLNAGHMLVPPRPRRKLTKYSDGKGNFYTLIDGENMVTVNFQDVHINKEGYYRNFLNERMITMEEFNKLNTTHKETNTQ